jgi:hypothetical protein
MTGMPRAAPPRWRRSSVVALGLALVVGPLGVVRNLGAENWGGLTPGESTHAQVESLYGRPSRERPVTEEGRTVAEWTYAADRAPRGLERMVVSFGLMVGGRFMPDVVRAIGLYPKPHVFSLLAISNGWGKPEAIGTEDATGRPSFHYSTKGLLIILDKTGGWAEFMLFGPRQAAGGS